MAFLVLLSSTSFTVSTHYCKGEVADVAFFFENESCNDDSEFACTDSSAAHVEEDACCSTNISFVDGEDFPDKQNDISLKVKIAYTIPFYEQYIFVKTFWNTVKIIFTHSFPPVIKNFTILFETFLI